MARDLSHFTDQHFVIVTSYGEWHNQTNSYLVTELHRVGSPGVASMYGNAPGTDKPYMFVGIPRNGSLAGRQVCWAIGDSHGTFVECDQNLEYREDVLTRDDFKLENQWANPCEYSLRFA